jgi:ABC-type uncharacterized transport system involved in gliding motility auxiliary subunit
MLWQANETAETRKQRQNALMAYYAIVLTGKTLIWGVRTLKKRSNQKAMERDLERLLESHGVIFEDELLED